MTERHGYRQHERHSPAWDRQRGGTLPRVATLAPYSINKREMWASGPQAGTDRLVVALEVGRSSATAVITCSLGHHPKGEDGPHLRTSAALAAKTRAGNEAQRPAIVYALLAPHLECLGAPWLDHPGHGYGADGSLDWSPAYATLRRPAIRPPVWTYVVPC